ncbi:MULTISPECIES: hypothetical protein [Streptomyces]|uniref:Uncharacterized protein n=1 Tax=Streptomyces flaveolus TaxID=67297 RepID=A0ABV1VJE5_9ACTN
MITDDTALAGFDIAVITVPIPLRGGVPNLTYVETCAPEPWTVSRGACVA